jgi:ribosomal protein S27E
MNYDELRLYAVNCSDCGHPTVVTGIEARPDLCHPCFVATLNE